MSLCDILVCPSYSEGMPNVILEAMARSLTINATDVGAINVMVSERNGWLIDKCGVKNIVTAMIAAIMCGREEMTLKKTNAYNIVKENFMWEKIVGNLINVLRKIIEGEKYTVCLF